MSTYPGNVALSNAVKERVVSTFQQALTLFKQGRADEVVQGCGLILRMDPQFEPAKKLMEKARNPNAPIDVDALAQQLTADPMTEARKAMAARNFQKVVDTTTEILTNDLMNEEARLLNEQAREKLEASPFVDQFVKKAEQAIASGDVNSARADLEKIKSLDAPPPAQPAKSPEGEFDFATASIETSPDDQKKIQQYLADGDRAFDAGDFQGAIDLWSRVFLIDVTNDQASERIDRAKKKRREAEQRSENLLASAIQMFDKGDRNGARERFTQVLQLDPT